MAQTDDRTVTDEGLVTWPEVRRLLQQHFVRDEVSLLEASITHWRRACYGVVGTLVIVVLACVGLAMRPALVPYPIVYHPDGWILWHGPAQTTREERLIDVALIEIMTKMREVTPDEVVFSKWRSEIESMMQGKALEQWMIEDKTRVAQYKDTAKRVLVTVDRGIEVNREGASRVRLTWTETWTPEYGYGRETRRFTMLLDYQFLAQPARWTYAQAQANPRRLYITDYRYDEIRQEGR